MKRTLATQEESPTLDMSSLIDVSFLLLIYFIVTSTLDPKESDIGMRLPDQRGITPIQPDIDPMEIEVDAQGRILINDEVIDSDPTAREVPALLDRLITYAKSAELINSEPLIVVSADDAAKGQRFVDVLNAMAHDSVKIKSVTISGFVDD